MSITARKAIIDGAPRPERAVVGSHREKEEIFGAVYDPRIVRRIWSFVAPYRRQVAISVAAVLVFTLTQLAIPLIIRTAIDSGMAGGIADHRVLLWCSLAFAATILVNYAASYVQETVVGSAAERVRLSTSSRSSLMVSAVYSMICWTEV